jgi:cytoplasmic iron level regulating protein YaaA (DUF328/UPF0246 family)
VSLILEKLVEIPSKEERKQKKLVSLHRSTNKELTAIGNDLLDKTRKLEEETAEKLREMRKLAFPDES